MQPRFNSCFVCLIVSTCLFQSNHEWDTQNYPKVHHHNKPQWAVRLNSSGLWPTQLCLWITNVSFLPCSCHILEMILRNDWEPIKCWQKLMGCCSHWDDLAVVKLSSDLNMWKVSKPVQEQCFLANYQIMLSSLGAAEMYRNVQVINVMHTWYHKHCRLQQLWKVCWEVSQLYTGSISGHLHHGMKRLWSRTSCLALLHTPFDSHLMPSALETLHRVCWKKWYLHCSWQHSDLVTC